MSDVLTCTEGLRESQGDSRLVSLACGHSQLLLSIPALPRASREEKDTPLKQFTFIIGTIKKSFKDYQYCITKSEVMCLQNIYRI